MKGPPKGLTTPGREAELAVRAARQEERRLSFDAAAEAYDEYRQGYPDALFEALSARVPPPARVLEIASGTGQATLPLAQRGYQLRCVELGEKQAAVARKKLADHPNVQIDIGRFEEANVAPDSADLAVCASAFHWLHHARALPRIATALRPSGLLALLWTSPPHEAADPFAIAAQSIYLRHAHELLAVRTRESAPARMSRAIPGVLLGSAVFTDCTQQEFRFQRTLSTRSFLGLLGTYSNYLTLAAPTRAALFAELGELLERDFGGSLTLDFRSVLQLARRR